MSQGFLSRFQFGAAGMRRLFNLWPPFRAAGIRVREIAPDFRSATVELRMKLLNRNYVGTHFGGSLFAMTDPFFMILMMKNLGPDYVVWDKEGTVRFLKPARGTVTAHFKLPDRIVCDFRRNSTEPLCIVHNREPLFLLSSFLHSEHTKTLLLHRGIQHNR